MAVTPLAGRTPRRRPKPRWLMALHAACMLAAAVSAGEAPSPDPGAADAGKALEAAEACIRQLDGLRPIDAANDARVAAVLKKGLTVLDEADAALKRQLNALAPEKKPLRGTANRKMTADLMRLRAVRCRVGLARGGLYVHAALARPGDVADRADFLKKAVAAYRSLRVDFHDIAPGLMGYVGEARAQRLAGDAKAARDALKTLFQIPEDPGNALAADLRRVALLEDLEALLVANPEEVTAKAQELRRAKEYKDRPGWQARLDYVVAQAHVAQAERLRAGASAAARKKELIEKAAGLLRRDAVIQIAPQHDRLALLRKLETLSSGPLLRRDELLAWADLLAAAGRDEAVAFYNRAKGSSDEPLAARQLLAYITLAMKQQRYRETADACDRLLELLTADDAKRPPVLGCRAAALLKVLEAADAGRRPAGLDDRTLGALRAVVGSASPDPLRRDALKQWVAIESRRSGLTNCLKMLTDYNDLARGDAYLLYCGAAARWQVLSEELAGGAVEKAAAEGRARRILADLAVAADAASAAADTGVLARSTLLRVQALARPPLGDRRQALSVLDAGLGALKDDPAVAGAAAWLRVELLLDLGLIEEASKALAKVPEGREKGSPLARLRLAEALARRYASVQDTGRSEVQRRVLDLCDAAVAQAVADERQFVAASRRAARALLDVGASADARRFLEKLLASRTVRDDAKRLEGCSLMMVEAYRQSRQLNQAVGLLDQLAARFPKSVQVHLALGRVNLDLRRADRAVASFRKARGLCRPGTPDWCRATLALAEGLVAGRHDGDATDILRVAEALHPDFGDPELRSQLKALRGRLQSRRPREPVRER